MSMSGQDKDLSREEDFRDFEQRDVEEGWPYADGAGQAPVANRAYGQAGGNFEQERNSGFRLKSADETGAEPGLNSPVLPETDHREISDQLESDIAERLEALDGISLETIDIHVDGRRVTLEGLVDTPTERHRIEQAALAVAGVTEVRNMIRTAGVDTHIPDAD